MNEVSKKNVSKRQYVLVITLPELEALPNLLLAIIGEEDVLIRFHFDDRSGPRDGKCHLHWHHPDGDVERSNDILNGV